jgi:hypothetical protein
LQEEYDASNHGRGLLATIDATFSSGGDQGLGMKSWRIDMAKKADWYYQRKG